jgi:hypothetical protein
MNETRFVVKVLTLILTSRSVWPRQISHNSSIISLGSSSSEHLNEIPPPVFAISLILRTLFPIPTPKTERILNFLHNSYRGALIEVSPSVIIRQFLLIFKAVSSA